VAVEGRADLPASGAGDRPPGSVQSSLLVASLIPCASSGPLFGCLVGSGGELRIAGVDIARPREQRAPWLAAGVRIGAELEAGNPVTLRSHAELLRTLLQHHFTIDGTHVYETPGWAASLGAALALNFP
jgi:hypothetical protein